MSASSITWLVGGLEISEYMPWTATHRRTCGKRCGPKAIGGEELKLLWPICPVLFK